MPVVKELQENDRTNWETYVAKAQIDSHAYCWQWRSIIEKTFHHTPFYYGAFTEDHSQTLVGILPLFHVKSFLFGEALISVPYTNGGGILADSESAFHALLKQAQSLANKKNAAYLELRHRSSKSELSMLAERSHKVAVKMALDENPENLFTSFPAKLRSQIRRPSKSGVVARVSGINLGEKDSLEAFYSVFCENMRDLGTPVYPKSLFLETKKLFQKQARIITVWYEEKPIAAGMTIGNQRTVEIPWASSLRRYNKMSPNMLLYWEAIKTACSDGYKEFDFGRSSPDSGTYRFKLQWGGDPMPLCWYYDSPKGAIPDINPKSSRFALLVSGWRHLPLPICNLLGPRLTRGIP